MSGVASLSKILNVREQEKKSAEKDYRTSMNIFESVAMKLYEALKKKENAENAYESYLQEVTPIDVIKEQVAYIEILNKQIVHLQKEVQQARTAMEIRQDKLADAHIEVKKFEKIIEHRQQEKEEMIKKEEKAMMDEISIQQYLSYKNR
ncbi:flagellar export protein FliJ [Aciduricibacillus chroicocephali]|uniref:Flagellar FliJ protein n=1 Tax=Aciduricibacillus chroicocephali TaxID=3054939 RepID=A0ABY9L1K8_9BACI|nr:flagellar export protein FliJ [Bacillaceae bacterium 44XB]